jgi:hypothetical protein
MIQPQLLASFFPLKLWALGKVRSQSELECQLFQEDTLSLSQCPRHPKMSNALNFPYKPWLSRIKGMERRINKWKIADRQPSLKCFSKACAERSTAQSLPAMSLNFRKFLKALFI